VGSITNNLVKPKRVGPVARITIKNLELQGFSPMKKDQNLESPEDANVSVGFECKKEMNNSYINNNTIREIIKKRNRENLQMSVASVNGSNQD
jgi:hypothetical protein